LAWALGADQVLASASRVPPATFDKALECSGSVKAQTAAIEAVRPQGRVVLIGIATEPTVLQSFALVYGERELVGSLSHIVDEDFREAVDLLTMRAVQVEPLIFERVPLCDAVSIFEALDAGTLNGVKILMYPTPMSPEADNQNGCHS
jgi:alcohol dehydrogenase/propanol-preferring alcohol dehydrogenase